MKYCYLVWGDDGNLVCTVNHREYKNCDLAATQQDQSAEGDAKDE